MTKRITGCKQHSDQVQIIETAVSGSLLTLQIYYSEINGAELLCQFFTTLYH